MRQGVQVFVDTGAWIALALTRDPLHARARELWEIVLGNGAKLRTSVPVALETFTFLDRNAHRDVALAWRDSLEELPGLEVLPCGLQDLQRSWEYFAQKDLHRLSAVDATSFAIMRRRKIGLALAFDHPFAAVGFRMVG
jgi:predicted nucleic acid-binding protein